MIIESPLHTSHITQIIRLSKTAIKYNVPHSTSTPRTSLPHHPLHKHTPYITTPSPTPQAHPVHHYPITHSTSTPRTWLPHTHSTSTPRTWLPHHPLHKHTPYMATPSPTPQAHPVHGYLITHSTSTPRTWLPHHPLHKHTPYMATSSPTPQAHPVHGYPITHSTSTLCTS